MLRRLPALLFALFLFVLALAIPDARSTASPDVTAVESEAPVLGIVKALILPSVAIAQDSGISPDPEKSGHGPLFWLVIVAVLATVLFFGGRYLYRKYASPRQRSP